MFHTVDIYVSRHLQSKPFIYLLFSNCKIVFPTYGKIHSGETVEANANCSWLYPAAKATV